MMPLYIIIVPKKMESMI